MKYDVNTVEEYLASVPAGRREAVEKLLDVIGENIPDGFVRCLSYGMPGYCVPHSLYPAGYHARPAEPLPFISIASQKHFIGFYHMGLYSFPELLEWFRTEWGRLEIGKLDMGKSCIRFKKTDEIPYDLIGKLCSRISLRQWIEKYEQSILKT